jgi:hypothetical protein
MRFRKSLLGLGFLLAFVGGLAAATTTYQYKDTTGTIFNVLLWPSCGGGGQFCTGMVLEDSTGNEKATNSNPLTVDTSSSGNLINAVKALPPFSSGTPGFVDTNASGNLINAIKALPPLTSGTPGVIDTGTSGNLINAIKNPPGLGTTGGWTPLHIHNLLAVATTVKAAPGQLGLVQCDNVNGSTSYVQIFNALTGSVTLGTTPPTQTVPIAANSTNGFTLNLVGMQYSTAISVAVTTTDNGNSAPGTGLNCNFGYN